jgi:hypothetical protein
MSNDDMPELICHCSQDFIYCDTIANLKAAWRHHPVPLHYQLTSV